MNDIFRFRVWNAKTHENADLLKEKSEKPIL